MDMGACVMKSACRPERHVVVDYTIWKGKKKNKVDRRTWNDLFFCFGMRDGWTPKKTLRARVTVDSYIYIFFSLLWNIFFMKRLTQFHVEHFCYAPKRMESLFSKEQFALGVFCFFLIMDRNADGMFFVVFPLLSIWWWTMLVITLLPSGFSCFSGSTPSYCVSWVR